MTSSVICGTVEDVLPNLPARSFDAVLCDPPYGLSFMGKGWDHGVPSADIWRDVLRVVKPGGMLLAFGGTRTHHRLMVNIEDAGWEIRDCLMWLYGSGFPKSLDISKAIDKAAGAEREVLKGAGRSNVGTGARSNGASLYGQVFVDATNAATVRNDISLPSTDAARQWSGYGTALKPAWEPIILAMKPLDGTYAANALAHGVAGLNIDGSRIGMERTETRIAGGKGFCSNFRDDGWIPPAENETRTSATAGRWPANVLLDADAAPMLGAPARYFYTAKASRSEREAGVKSGKRNGGSNVGGYVDDVARGLDRNRPVANHHPTVKPIDLIRYLAKLILPPQRDTPRHILVPYCGSGSEMIGCRMAGWDDVTGVEMDADYATIARQRLDRWMPDSLMLEMEDA